jgi:hypothetical protein
MNTDGTPTIASYRIKGLGVRKGGAPIKLVPFGDVHHDSPAHCRNKWKEFLSWAKDQDPARTIFLGMGDYMDGHSASERSLLSSRVLHDSTTVRMADEATERLDAFAKDIEFMRGRLIGLLSGNHYVELPGGIHGDQYLAGKLGCQFLGCFSMVRLYVHPSTKSTTQISVDIAAHHGIGGGKTPTGRMKSVEDMARMIEADIYLMGHNHARGVGSGHTWLYLAQAPSEPTGLIMKSRDTVLGRTGSFLKSYEPGMPSYVVDSCMPPASLGWIWFELSLRRLPAVEGRRFTFTIRAIQ